MPLRPASLPDPFPPFRRLHDHRVELLEALSPEDWFRAVPDSAWTVKDTAAHLLDGDLRRLSFQRDRMTPLPPETPIRGPEDLVAFLDRLNAEWIRAAQRLSPGVILDMTRWAGAEVVELFEAADPDGEALFPVAWAGEQRSVHRFDVARELTEKWVHQQQIRDAVGRPGPETPDAPQILQAVVATFLHALPHTYREIPAPEGTHVAIRIHGEAGGEWVLRREAARPGANGWRLLQGHVDPAGCAAAVDTDADTAWRVLSTRRKKAGLLPKIEITGDRRLAAGFTSAVAVMA